VSSEARFDHGAHTREGALSFTLTFLTKFILCRQNYVGFRRIVHEQTNCLNVWTWRIAVLVYKHSELSDRTPRFGCDFAVGAQFEVIVLLRWLGWRFEDRIADGHKRGTTTPDAKAYHRWRA